MFSKLKLAFSIHMQTKKKDTFSKRFITNYRADNPTRRELHNMIRKLAGDLHYMEKKVFTLMNDSETYELRIEQIRISTKHEIDRLNNPAELIKKAQDVTSQSKGLLMRLERIVIQ